jgi:hypothetical protein
VRTARLVRRAAIVDLVRWTTAEYRAGVRNNCASTASAHEPGSAGSPPVLLGELPGSQTHASTRNARLPRRGSRGRALGWQDIRVPNDERRKLARSFDPERPPARCSWRCRRASVRPHDPRRREIIGRLAGPSSAVEGYLCAACCPCHRNATKSADSERLARARRRRVTSPVRTRGMTSHVGRGTLGTLSGAMQWIGRTFRGKVPSTVLSRRLSTFHCGNADLLVPRAASARYGIADEPAGSTDLRPGRAHPALPARRGRTTASSAIRCASRVAHLCEEPSAAEIVDVAASDGPEK